MSARQRPRCSFRKAAWGSCGEWTQEGEGRAGSPGGKGRSGCDSSRRPTERDSNSIPGTESMSCFISRKHFLPDPTPALQEGHHHTQY